MRKKVVFIYGPTASGKSEIAVSLAKKFNGEIINADSQQLFKYMDIGTAKVTTQEKKKVLHHLLDVYLPDEQIDAFKFCTQAESIILKLINKNKLPIVVGGTGLYMRMLSGDMAIHTVQIDDKFKSELNNKSLEELVKIAKKADKKDFYKINESDIKNKRRLISFILRKSQNGKAKYFCKGVEKLKLALAIPKDYTSKICKRVQNMLKKGLIEEARKLNEKYPNFKKNAKAIGYRESLSFLSGEIKTQDGLSKIVAQKTLQYSKRQITWLKKEKSLSWVKNYDEAAGEIEQFLQ